MLTRPSAPCPSGEHPTPGTTAADRGGCVPRAGVALRPPRQRGWTLACTTGAVVSGTGCESRHWGFPNPVAWPATSNRSFTAKVAPRSGPVSDPGTSTRGSTHTVLSWKADVDVRRALLRNPCSTACAPLRRNRDLRACLCHSILILEAIGPTMASGTDTTERQDPGAECDCDRALQHGRARIDDVDNVKSRVTMEIFMSRKGRHSRRQAVYGLSESSKVLASCGRDLCIFAASVASRGLSTSRACTSHWFPCFCALQRMVLALAVRDGSGVGRGPGGSPAPSEGRPAATTVGTDGR